MSDFQVYDHPREVASIRGHEDRDVIFLNFFGRFFSQYIFDDSSTSDNIGPRSIRPTDIEEGDPGRWLWQPERF